MASHFLYKAQGHTLPGLLPFLCSDHKEEDVSNTNKKHKTRQDFWYGKKITSNLHMESFSDFGRSDKHL